MQIPHYFEDLDHLHINTEPDRAYYIPEREIIFWIVKNQTVFFS